jgi:hypothetical protein
MIKDTNQTQEAGDNSVNYQAATIIQTGLTYREAKEVALDVFKENFLTLKAHAAEVAAKRAEELVEKFIDEVKDKPELLNAVQEPSMQAALYSAQKSYAISGDEDLADMLVDILVERAGRNDHRLRRIVLDESLEVAAKLTAKQLDLLTIVFLFKFAKFLSVTSLETLKKTFEISVKPFTHSLPPSTSDFQHLEYCNCGTLSVAAISLEDVFWRNYHGLFCKGFTEEEFENTVGPVRDFDAFIGPCFLDKSKLRILALDGERLKEELVKRGYPDETVNNLHNFFYKTIQSGAEVAEYFRQIDSFMPRLFDSWTNGMDGLTLTTVGIALAHANFRRRTGQSLDLSIWIK